MNDQRKAAYAGALTVYRDYPSAARLGKPRSRAFGLSAEEAAEVDRVILEELGEWDFAGVPAHLQPRPREQRHRPPQPRVVLLGEVPPPTAADRPGWEIGRLFISTMNVPAGASLIGKIGATSTANLAGFRGLSLRLWPRKSARPRLAVVVGWRHREGHPS